MFCVPMFAQRATIAGAILLAAATAAGAQAVDRKTSADRKLGEIVSVSLYGGYMSGQSRELVYDAATGQKVSELFWKINKATVVGGTLAVTPWPWLTFKAGGWIPLASRNTMDDYDWTVSGLSDWTDWSHHEDTQMTQAYNLDLRFGVRVFSLPATPLFDQASFHLIGGYRWFNIRWTASGGDYIYTPNGGGFRSDIGSFPNGQPVITYEQWMETPFLGVGASFALERWSLEAEVVGSLSGRAHDRDDHHVRSILFTEDFSGVKMIGTNATLNYGLTERLSVFARFDYQQYFEAQSSSTATNYATGVVTYSPGNAAGMDHYSMIVSFGLKAGLF